MRGFDLDVRTTLADEMRKTGIDLRFDADIAGIERNGGNLRATLKDGQTLETDAVMFATGRLPNTRGLGIEEVGVELARNGAVVVDERYQTSVPSIWALGDVTDRVKLTPVALAEAMVFARNLFKGDVGPMHYRNIPSAVFSQPPVGTVGYTEEAARENCGEVDIYRADFRPLKHTLSGRDEKTMMKLIVERAGERVVGCHMVGADAGEIIQGMAVAVNCGATKADFDRTVGIHPTAAEEFVTMREPVAAGD